MKACIGPNGDLLRFEVPRNRLFLKESTKFAKQLDFESPHPLLLKGSIVGTKIFYSIDAATTWVRSYKHNLPRKIMLQLFLSTWLATQNSQTIRMHKTSVV